LHCPWLIGHPSTSQDHSEEDAALLQDFSSLSALKRGSGVERFGISIICLVGSTIVESERPSKRPPRSNLARSEHLPIEDINILASADLHILAGDFTVRVFPSVQCIDAAMPALIDHLQFGTHWKPSPPPVSFDSQTIRTLSVPPRMHLAHVDCTKAKH
jgi:hypothetical protein